MLDTARKFRKEDISPLSHVEALLDRIRQSDLNAYVTLNGDNALVDAKAAAQSIDRGDEDLLAGIAVAVKDNISTRNLRTTCSSNMLRFFVPPYDAHVIGLLRERGAVILGKTNMDEFAMGSTTTTSAFGPTKNPWDVTKTPAVPAAVPPPRWPQVCATVRWAPTPGFCQAACKLLRHHRPEAHLWIRVALRPGGLCLVARPDRTHGKERPRRGVLFDAIGGTTRGIQRAYRNGTGGSPWTGWTCEV
jgi:hypothetical protein